MISKTIVLIDGGGTSTSVAVVRSGEISHRTILPSFKPDAESLHTDDLTREIGSWLAGIDLGVLAPNYILVGMAGVWSSDERQRYMIGFRDSWATYIGSEVERLSVVSDVELVQLAAFGSNSGTVLIAGTGSIAVARLENGNAVRCGGWGKIIGDEGSGYWFGLEALKAVSRMIDGRGAATQLIRPVASYLRADSQDIVSIAAALRAAPSAHVASIAQAVLTYATEGDEVAKHIRELGSQHLAALVTTIAEKNTTVTLHGSLFKNEPFRTMVSDQLSVLLPTITTEWLDDVLAGVAGTLRSEA